MFRAMGYDDEDLSSPMIGVANPAADITPCNVHLDDVADVAIDGVDNAGGMPIEFGTITISDAISMGTEGMKASLISREVIADSVELVAFGERIDGLVTVAGCDKNLPGMMMASIRTDLPSVFLYGGSIMPGEHDGREVTIQNVFEGVGAVSSGKMSEDELGELERHATRVRRRLLRRDVHREHDGVDQRGDRSRAARERQPARRRPERYDVAERAGELAVEVIEADRRPSDILSGNRSRTPLPFRPRSAGRPTPSSTCSPWLAKPGSTSRSPTSTRSATNAEDRRPPARRRARDERPPRGRGVPVVVRRLLDAGLIHGDAMTVTGRTIEEELEELDLPAADEIDVDFLYSIEEPKQAEGAIKILEGNLARDGAVLKATGDDAFHHEGPARVFENEEDAMRYVRRATSRKRGRHRHPERGPTGRPRHAGCSA